LTRLWESKPQILADSSVVLTRLGIHDGGAWVSVPSLLFALGLVKSPKQEGPGTFEAQAAEVV
jgi:hypothetical protein